MEDRIFAKKQPKISKLLAIWAIFDFHFWDWPGVQILLLQCRIFIKVMEQKRASRVRHMKN